MTRSKRLPLEIDVLVASARWNDAAAAKAMVRRAVTHAAATMRLTEAMELAIVLTDDSAIRVLNRDWRGVDAATNVLSFPAKTATGKNLGGHLGDIVLAFETVVREARDARKPLAHHVAHLAIHGFLHLIGYDHEREDDAVAMEQTERAILRQLAIPDPYRPRTRQSPVRTTTARATIKKAAKPVAKPAAKHPAAAPGGRSLKS
ncbi:MAG: rRNA maturation RNase YbeY [Xanthobacteraceae bacterium]|jgi:probable rRNA maturation factor